MDFFVRYFVELRLPAAAVETALNELPVEWMVAMVNKAYPRGLSFMLEEDSRRVDDLAGTVVEFTIEPATHYRSMVSRKMAWALIGPSAIRPLLDGDLDLGPLGPRGCQLAVAGRYYVPGTDAIQRVDRGMAQRAGEATIKEFVDGMANAIEKLALGVPALRIPTTPLFGRLKVL